jgi:sugar O-acyltransferase (sialic acid O-acetyltransferase NeuD family)
MAETFVIGAGGHARVVIAAMQSAGYVIDGVLDDDEATHGSVVEGVPVIGVLTLLERYKDVCAVIAIGSNSTRRSIAARFPAVQWMVVVHSSAWIAPSVSLGAGTVVSAGAVVQPGAIVGRHCIVNTMTSVDHDCSLEDFVHLAPGVRLAGNVRVDEGALLGVAAHAIPGVRIGAWSVVGAGSTVVADLPADCVSFGNPARVRRKVIS